MKTIKEQNQEYETDKRPIKVSKGKQVGTGAEE